MQMARNPEQGSISTTNVEKIEGPTKPFKWKYDGVVLKDQNTMSFFI